MYLPLSLPLRCFRAQCLKRLVLGTSNGTRTSCPASVPVRTLQDIVTEQGPSSALEKDADGRIDRQYLSAYAHTRLEHLCGLNIHTPPPDHCLSLSGIICTVGPSCRSVDMLEQLLAAGMIIARLNFSHGSHEYHEESIDMIRRAAEKSHRPVAIAVDTKGPEVRTGIVKGGIEKEILLTQDDVITLTVDEHYKDKCDEKHLWVNYKNLVKTVALNGRISMADGLITLLCIEKGSDHLVCKIENTGYIGSRSGCNFPGAVLTLPAVSESDIKDLNFAVEQDIDIVFASFIRKAQAVVDVKNILGDRGKYIKVLAKVENDEGVRNFDAILKESDGIMVARGDLGTEIPMEKVFLAQKMMISRCNRMGKPVVCATQMLESMRKNPAPTRAEASDVANAILDGADCVMLSGETAKGAYPVRAVTTMARIVREAEYAIYHRQLASDLRLLTKVPINLRTTTAISAVQASMDCMASAIIVMTATGITAQTVSAYRPRCPVIAVTRDQRAARQLNLYRGVLGNFYETTTDDWMADMDSRIRFSLNIGIERGIIYPGSNVVVVTGWKQGQGYTNTMQIITVSEEANENEDVKYYTT